MTDEKLLGLLEDYYATNIQVIQAMRVARWHFEYKDDQVAWKYLFLWRELIDERDEIFARLGNNCGRAVLLAWG